LWNASTNTPALTSSVGTSGNFYIVSVAGSTNLNGITNWDVGDWAIFNGSVWQRVEGGANGNFTTLSVSGVATFSAGTVSAPAITTSGDTNTGVYFPAADEVGITAGGTERMRISSTGISSVSSILSSGGATQVGVTQSTYGSSYSTVVLSYPETHVRPNAGYSGSISFTENTVADRWSIGIKPGDSNLYFFNVRNITAATGILAINSSGAVIHPAGTAALPSITTTGDTNTGVYFPAADTVGITTAGAEAMRIISSGSVGIGGSPTSRLDVVGNTSGTFFSARQTSANASVVSIQPYNASNGGIIYSNWATGNGTLDFGSGGTTVRMSLDNGGNLTVTGTLSTSGVAKFPAGTVALPSITTSGDTNTGIYFPAADTIAFTEGGAEAMRIDSSGNVGIGTSSLTGYNLRVSKNITGAVESYAITAEGTVQSDVTSVANGFYTSIGTQNSAFTLPAVYHFRAVQGTFGASSTVTNQYCFFAPGGAIGATTNYGFYAGNSAGVTSGKTAYGFRSDVNIATGGGTTYGFYSNGTAENYFAGNVGIGAVAGSTTGQLRIAGNGSGATTFNGISLETSVQSGVTSAWRGLLIRPTTQATAFTLNNLYGVYINPQTFGAGSTVTNQYGVHVENTLTGATNNYGFYSNIASGSNRYNFYANGTADNYFAGNVGIGTAAPTAKLDVSSDVFRLRTSKTPASASATGNAGDICWDSSYIYVCTATNTWKRVAIATW
jgi:hypothetical protein